jgi:hypothetical protein
LKAKGANLMPVRQLTPEEAEEVFWKPGHEQNERERLWTEWYLFGWKDGTPRPECPGPAFAKMQKAD